MTITRYLPALAVLVLLGATGAWLGSYRGAAVASAVVAVALGVAGLWWIFRTPPTLRDSSHADPLGSGRVGSSAIELGCYSAVFGCAGVVLLSISAVWWWLA